MQECTGLGSEDIHTCHTCFRYGVLGGMKLVNKALMDKNKIDDHVRMQHSHS